MKCVLQNINKKLIGKKLHIPHTLYLNIKPIPRLQRDLSH